MLEYMNCDRTAIYFKRSRRIIEYKRINLNFSSNSKFNNQTSLMSDDMVLIKYERSSSITF